MVKLKIINTYEVSSRQPHLNYSSSFSPTVEHPPSSQCQQQMKLSSAFHRTSGTLTYS